MRVKTSVRIIRIRTEGGSTALPEVPAKNRKPIRLKPDPTESGSHVRIAMRRV